MPQQTREARKAFIHDLIVEEARPDDMAVVSEMIRSSKSWYRRFIDPDDMSEHDPTEEWEEKNYELRDFYLGRLGDEPIGTVSLQYPGDYAYVGYLYLYTDHVGNGYGGDLLDFAVRQARRMGKKAMVLLCHPKAVWAVRAYEKYGFRVIAKSKEDVLAWEGGWMEPYYEEGFHLMRYEL
jgi:GNAT superfamily N-acetyltransferase